MGESQYPNERIDKIIFLRSFLCYPVFFFLSVKNFVSRQFRKESIQKLKAEGDHCVGVYSARCPILGGRFCLKSNVFFVLSYAMKHHFCSDDCAKCLQYLLFGAAACLILIGLREQIRMSAKRNRSLCFYYGMQHGRRRRHSLSRYVLHVYKQGSIKHTPILCK